MERLSKRERQVLDELARGSHTEEMARALHLSPHTIRSHVKTLLRKLGARTRAHAVAIAYSHGRPELSS
jgi:DNA-binding CsgD family transcriptional regulator